MQRPMRRAERATEDEAAFELLERAAYGVLSTVGSDGLPYAVPISHVVRNGVIYLHCALEGRKLDNIAAQPAVSFCVVGHTKLLPGKFSTEYESAIASGKARLVGGEEKQQALIGFLEKYSPEFLQEGMKYLAGMIERTTVVCIDIDHISGKARS